MTSTPRSKVSVRAENLWDSTKHKVVVYIMVRVVIALIMLRHVAAFFLPEINNISVIQLYVAKPLTVVLLMGEHDKNFTPRFCYSIHRGDRKVSAFQLKI